MNFTPVNKHIEIEPIEEKGHVFTQNNVYEEKGKVISCADDTELEWNAGEIVYFDSWLVAKYTDTNGKDRWLVPEENIRAYEQISEQ